jgi:hypothetical protein
VATPAPVAPPATARLPYPTALAHFPTLRQSLLATFADCQLQTGFDLRSAIPKPGSQILHTSGYTTHRQAAGRLIHSTIGRAIRHMVEVGQEQIPPEIVIGLWEDELRQASEPVSETFALPAHEDALARRTLRKWARDNTFTIADIYGIEERLAAPIHYPDGHGGMVERILTGQLDLLLIDKSGTHATVPDWKDTWKLPPARDDDWDGEELEDDGDDELSLEGYFQQRTYAPLIFLQPELRAVQSVTLREFYVRRSKPREATLWRHQLPELLSYLSATAERFDRCYEAAIRTRRNRVRPRPLATPAQWGEPSPGAHCFNCPGRIDCPVPPEARIGGMIGSPADAEMYGGILIRAQAVVKLIEQSMRTWADKEGPTRIRDAKRERFYGYVIGERVERPTLAQVKAAMLAGRDPTKLFKRRTHTRFTHYTPTADVTRGLAEDDTVAMFERAAELAKRDSGRPRTRG